MRSKKKKKTKIFLLVKIIADLRTRLTICDRISREILFLTKFCKYVEYIYRKKEVGRRGKERKRGREKEKRGGRGEGRERREGGEKEM